MQRNKCSDVIYNDFKSLSKNIHTCQKSPEDPLVGKMRCDCREMCLVQMLNLYDKVKNFRKPFIRLYLTYCKNVLVKE